jgi:nitrite reductase/ring-hydroxylating ferredoxin subunit
MWIAVAKLADVRADDVMEVTAGGVDMIVGRAGDTVFAMQRLCPHRGADLSYGAVVRGHLICAHHGWRFSIATGRHDGGSGACLVRYPVRIEADMVEVDPEQPSEGAAARVAPPKLEDEV